MSVGVPALVVFDIGGVLVRICRSWREACVSAGEACHELTPGEAALAARREVVAEYELGRISCDEFCARMCEVLASSGAGAYTPQQFRRIHDAFLVREYPGVGVLVDVLHAAGVRTAILSNTNQSHWERLAPAPALPAPEFPAPRRVGNLFASHLMHLGKPAVEVYRFVSVRLGVRPEDVLFFDDSQANIDAAARVGWRGEVIDHAGDPARQMYRACLRAGLVGQERGSERTMAT